MDRQETTEVSKQNGVDTLNLLKNKLEEEMKAQKLGDKEGWKTVKEYEGPDLASNEDDAKAISKLRKLDLKNNL